MKKIYYSLLLFVLSLGSCTKNDQDFDASGSFEATETIVSSEANGKITLLNINEGDELKAGQIVGYVDSTQLYLNRLQLIQNKKAILSGRPNIQTQIEALQKELDNAFLDQKRIENLVKGQVASQKQLDDANSRVTMLRSRIDAQKSSLGTTTQNLQEQSRTVELQLKQIEDQLRKCRIVNPVNGTVLVRYSNVYEVTSVGKPLYKIADLSEINLKAYITSDQFASIKLGQKVKIKIDDTDGKQKEYEGMIEWINDKAEFTPKTIQTKNERANLVYAIKMKVKNDGALKIGMYGEVLFN